MIDMEPNYINEPHLDIENFCLECQLYKNNECLVALLNLRSLYECPVMDALCIEKGVV